MASIDGRKWVYVLGDDEGRIKIGVATDLASRRAQYRTHNPSSLTEHLIQWCSAARADAIEQSVHGAFADRRIQGEWFRVSPDEAVAAVHQAMATTGQLPLAIGLSTVGRRPEKMEFYHLSMRQEGAPNDWPWVAQVWRHTNRGDTKVTLHLSDDRRVWASVPENIVRDHPTVGAAIAYVEDLLRHHSEAGAD